MLVTGGGGFLGSFIVERIAREKPAALLVPRRDALDVRDPVAVREYLKQHKPDLVIHAAAVVGGIGANRAAPGRFFYDNAVMGIHLIEESRLAGVEKFVCLGTTCAYPKFTPVPFREDDLWNGLNGIFLLPVNLYGPRDSFDLETSHVIPAMIRKFDEARTRSAKSVTLWGDGSPTREFLYVQDAAEGIVRAAELYDADEPVNIGSGVEISIADLAALIARGVGYEGVIEWDTSKPNGQPRRRLDTTRAKERFGFESHTSLEDGIARTIEWYRSTCVESQES